MHCHTQQYPSYPAMEAMEDRLMLSTYSILSSHYLDVGNEWQYATSTTTMGVEMVTGVTTHEITGTQSVSGKPCAVFHDIVTLTNKFGGGTTTSTSDVYYAVENNMLLLYGTSESNGSTSTVINNDPLETFPSTINSTDKNRLLGQGQFHEIDTAGGTTYDDTRVRKISYLGRENLTLTVNGQSKTFSCYKIMAVNTVTRTGDSNVYKQEETGWIDPTVGSVKTVAVIYQGNTAFSTVTSTLTSYNVSIPDVPEQPTGTISILGNGTAIANGDTTPAAADFTDFGTLCTDKKTLTSTFIVSNTGLGKLKLIGKPRVAITGDAAADFKVTAQSATSVSTGHSTKFKIKFDPTAAGLRTATVTVLSDDPAAASYTFTIQGTGRIPMAEIDLLGKKVAIPNGSNAPSTANYTDFGSVLVKRGKFITKTFTITNTGDGPLLLTDPSKIVITGANASDFVVTSKPSSTINPGRSATFKIKFTPSSPGLKTALVSILSNDTALSDGVESPFTFTIQGTGTAV